MHFNAYKMEWEGNQEKKGQSKHFNLNILTGLLDAPRWYILASEKETLVKATKKSSSLLFNSG